MLTYLIVDVFYQEHHQQDKKNRQQNNARTVHNCSNTATVAGIRFYGVESCDILSSHVIHVNVAKNKFHAITDDYAVKRGTSKHPLYVTSQKISSGRAMLGLRTRPNRIEQDNI